MIDIDALFEKYFRNFVMKNSGRFTEDELEDKVGEIYSKFGSTPLKELGNESPKNYFANMTDAEIVSALRDSVKNDVSVSDFLCDELTEREGVFDSLVAMISTEFNDELSTYCVNIIRFNKRVRDAYKTMLTALCDSKCGVSLAETITEVLKEDADAVKSDILSVFDSALSAKKYFTEILSACGIDDDVTNVLIRQFVENKDEYSINAGYLGKYGDDRALPVLYDVIKKDNLPYLDYKEIKLAIEELGGEVDDSANYKDDAVYKKLH